MDVSLHHCSSRPSLTCRFASAASTSPTPPTPFPGDGRPPVPTLLPRPTRPNSWGLSPLSSRTRCGRLGPSQRSGFLPGRCSTARSLRLTTSPYAVGLTTPSANFAASTRKPSLIYAVTAPTRRKFGGSLRIGAAPPHWSFPLHPLWTPPGAPSCRGSLVLAKGSLAVDSSTHGGACGRKEIGGCSKGRLCRPPPWLTWFGKTFAVGYGRALETREISPFV